MKPTIVLVHGAFADASSWNDVIARLQQQGYTVIAPANPLRGVAADSAYPHNLIHYNKLDRGGHFAAWVQPGLFSAEMRAAFRSLR